MSINKKVLLPIISFVVVTIICFIFGNIFINKLTDRIIERVKIEIMRDYVPGPYSPGFDPDKVNSKIKTINSIPIPVKLEVKTPQEWNETWEKSRL